jgi:Pectate lyase superfamily protein
MSRNGLMSRSARRYGRRIVVCACLMASIAAFALPLWRDARPRSNATTSDATSINAVRPERSTTRFARSGRHLDDSSATGIRTDTASAAARLPPIRMNDSGLLRRIGAGVDGAQLTVGPIARPIDFFRATTTSTAGVSVKDFGAKGDGISDDTTAIQAALNATRTNPDGTPNQPSPDDYNGRPRFVYLPAGTYKVSNTLRWVGCCLTFRGDGAGATTIRLADSAPGFGSTANPKAVVQTESGNESFRQMVMDLAVDTGSGNPGAIGVNYISSNNGAMRNVLVRSGDGLGYAGLGMERAWTGPALIRDVEVRGFDYGVRVGPGEYGVTFEGLTLRNQRVAGILNRYGALNIRDLLSNNSVPVLIGSEAQGHFALLDADLYGGAAGTAAIQTQGEAYLRNVSSVGYANALSVRGTAVAGTGLFEYATRFDRAITGAPASLKLPYTDTPADAATPTAQWFRFPDAADYGNLRKLQGYLDSGAETLYFPFGVYFSYNEVAVTVPANVKRIIGFSSVINSDSRGTNGGGLRLIVEEASPDPLVIEQFGYGVKIDHRGPRTVVVKHGQYRYQDSAGSGDVVFEDVVMNPQVFAFPKHVWARQLNIETIGSRTAKIDNRAAQVWVLGFKTEGGGPIFTTSGTGATELLGGFMLPNVAETEHPAFTCDNARMSLSYRYEAYDAGGVNRKHTVQFREVRNGVVKDLRTDIDVTRRIGLIACGNG